MPLSDTDDVVFVIGSMLGYNVMEIWWLPQTRLNGCKASCDPRRGSSIRHAGRQTRPRISEAICYVTIRSNSGARTRTVGSGEVERRSTALQEENQLASSRPGPK